MRIRIVHSGWISSRWRFPGALRRTSENNIFNPNKPEKPRTSGAKSEWPSRCNAFAIVRFLDSLSLAYLCPCSSPLSLAAPQLISATIHVAERRSGKIRGGGAALRCTLPYFDHWTYCSSNFKLFVTLHHASETTCR